MKNLVTVEEAEFLIATQVRTYSTERVPFMEAPGRVLAEDILADRDMPPFNRVTMDGIAISYSAFAAGNRAFHIAGTQAAGEAPKDIIDTQNHCLEIMTGAVLPASLDTVIRYEDLEITGNTANILIDEIAEGQNIHPQGKDKKQGAVVAAAGLEVTPAIIGLAAFAGKTHLQVKKQPRVVIISSGDELVEVEEAPQPYQIRRSNVYSVQAALQKYGLAANLLHLPDHPEQTQQTILECLQNYDVILLSGGISMGKFDYVPKALEALSVAKIFHGVKQRPGKPFWFGASAGGTLVFAFPGNPVATFMCLHRYFLPWYYACIGKPVREVCAILSEEFVFEPQLQYFLQVKTGYYNDGTIIGAPIAGNGSGDFANLADTDAFMELPLHKTDFEAGEVYRIWGY